MSTLYWIACHVDMKILLPSMNNVHTLQRRVKCRNLSDIWRSTLKVGAGQFAPIQNPLVPTLPSWCLNRVPIRYGFRAGSKAIWYTVDHPASRGFLLARFWCTRERVDFQCRVIFTRIKVTFANKIEVMRERSLASVKVQKVEPRSISRLISAISILSLFYLRD